MALLIGVGAGHGGEDLGACHNGIVESELNMFLSRRVATAIRTLGSPFDVFLIRPLDGEDPSLMERGERSANAGCDFVIDLHTNASIHGHFHGVLGFHLQGDKIGRDISNTILRAWPRPLYKPGWASFMAEDDPDHDGIVDDRWLQRPKNVLKFHSCPSCLIEVGYCSNKRDVEALANGFVQDGMIAAIQAGLARLAYLKL